jgi:hypothetical protein
VTDKKLKSDDNIKKCWTKDFVAFDENVTVTQLEKLVERNHVMFVQKKVNDKVQVLEVSSKNFINLIDI